MNKRIASKSADKNGESWINLEEHDQLQEIESHPRWIFQFKRIIINKNPLNIAVQT